MSSVILEAHDLTKEYRHTVALDHIDLKIEKGKIYGFIGQNGAGKTSLFLRLVTGLAYLRQQDAYRCGENIGTGESDRLHDRNTCAFSDNDRLSKYGNTRIRRCIPDKAVIRKNSTW